jgi:hypothetical protein
MKLIILFIISALISLTLIAGKPVDFMQRVESEGDKYETLGESAELKAPLGSRLENGGSISRLNS